LLADSRAQRRNPGARVCVVPWAGAAREEAVSRVDVAVSPPRAGLSALVVSALPLSSATGGALRARALAAE